jgi:adipocyte plasma membrane-associated protein
LLAGHPILYADDVAVGPKTGHVYFSDASDVGISRTKADPTRWDTLGASIVDGIRGKRSGSLLVYDPQTRQTRALASGLWFANGVTVSPDESLVLVAETFLARVLSYDVRSGTLSPVGGQSAPLFMGYVDGAMHAENSGGSAVLVAVPSVAPKAVAVLSNLRPVWLQTALREVLLKLPPMLNTVRYACFQKVDYLTGRVLQTYVDEDGEALECVTSVVEKDGKFYLGSLKNHFIAVVDAV